MDILKKQYSICFAFFVDELKRIILMAAFAAVILTLVSTLYVKNNPDVGWEWMRNFIASMSFTEVFDDAQADSCHTSTNIIKQ